MKKIFQIFLVLLLPILLLAQTVAGEARIIQAIRKGDAHKLALSMDKSVAIKLIDQEGNYSKSQAEYVMKAFFQKYPPRNFSVKMVGKSNESGKYVIGNYTSGAQVYRVFFQMRTSGEQVFLQEIKIETES